MDMKKTLLAVLSIAMIIEAILGAGVLLSPVTMMGNFGVTSLNDEVFYLAAVIGWFCLVIAGVAGLAVSWVKQGRKEGLILAIALGIFWVCIGLHLALAFHRPQHFVLDAAKGLIILVLALRLQRSRAF